MNSFLSQKWLKIPVFLACLVPLGLLILAAFHDGAGQLIHTDKTFSNIFPSLTLGANPVQFIQHATGDWTLRFLIITLAITPFRKLLHLPALIRFRRMTGLFAFFYVCLHFTTYLWPDQDFDVHAMIKDFAKRPFITMGYTGFLLMIPLAVTSTRGWIRRLGGKRWQWLHRAIYISAIAGVIHYAWLVKSDERKPIQYAVMVGALLLYRVIAWIWPRRGAARASGSAASSPQHPVTAESE